MLQRESALNSYGKDNYYVIKIDLLTKKIRNMEVSWALGASYHLLNTYHESKKSGSPIMRPYKKSGKYSILSPPPRSSNLSSTPCPCDDLVFASGGALNDIVLNFTAAFICSRLYYGILNLLPSTIAQFA
uniref:Uncharacterized protein n=1 Tax=Romanomermis culicivorax TaxID=13658 RepID=A0A915KF08_ROMCU